MENVNLSINQVILADDDPDHGLLFNMVLHQVDASKNLTIVKDGNALMSLLSKQTPNLLFLDLNMPCKSGHERLEEIRQTPALKDLSIVVYSSSSHITDIKRSFMHQADLYMVKPFNLMHLKNALESVLQLEWKKNLPNQRFYFINNRFVPFTA